MSGNVAWLVLTLFIAQIAANHVMRGHVTYGGELETSVGTQPYWCETDVKMPLVMWEELCPDNCDDIKVEFCSRKRITLSGNLERDDFAPGVVLSFPDDEYLSNGCPTPPRLNIGGKPDQVIFREIVSVTFRSGRVRLVTKFVPGTEVVPDVKIHVGDSGPPTVRMLGTRRRARNTSFDHLNTTARAGAVGFQNFRRSGRVTLSQATQTTLDYAVTISAGVCDLDFRRVRPRLSWITRLNANAALTLNSRKGFGKAVSGGILDIPFPGLSFSKKIFLVGNIEMGLFVQLKYDSRMAVPAATTLQVRGAYKIAHKFTLKLFGANVRKIEGSQSFGVGNAAVKGRRRAGANVIGFVGIRPVVAAAVKVPILPDASADIGATVGLRANLRSKFTPYRPLYSGSFIGACKQCHYLRGPLSFLGLSFGSLVEIPLRRPKLFVFNRYLFSKSLGTACLFATTCPA